MTITSLLKFQKKKKKKQQKNKEQPLIFQEMEFSCPKKKPFQTF